MQAARAIAQRVAPRVVGLQMAPRSIASCAPHFWPGAPESPAPRCASTRFLSTRSFSSSSTSAGSDSSDASAASVLGPDGVPVEPVEPVADAVVDAAVEIPMVVDGAQEKAHEFQAETRQLLDILANSLYTEREVFLRELVSNAADALEKVRHMQVAGDAMEDPDCELGIKVTADTVNNRLIISDTGIGLTEEDMINNLGTIARSGSRQFMQELDSSASATSDIIGKFGVGFYSVFMVAEKVQVFSRHAAPGSVPLCWTSDGTGSFTITEAEGIDRGTRIVIHLNESGREFLEKGTVERVVNKYSNFVAFPIEVDGSVVNNVKALWTLPKEEVTEEMHTEFYRFMANAYDEPRYTIQFRSDAPLDMKVLLYIGKYHTEAFGMDRMDPGVNLYSRKVLIESKSPDILPDWMRFVKGVVDSEDLPLSISRERMQDSALLRKLNDVLSRRVIKHLERQATKEPEEYLTFFKEFGTFLKEGACMDMKNRDSISKLLRFETSARDSGELVSLDDYVSRCTPIQEDIYYLNTPNRELALNSPYYEAFRRNGIEVLFLYTPIDDFVMNNVAEYNGRKLVSAESPDIDLTKDKAKTGDEDEKQAEAEDALRMANALGPEAIEELGTWLSENIDSIESVRSTDRLVDSPAIVVDHQGAAMRRMLKMVDRNPLGENANGQAYTLEVNPTHDIVKGLNEIRVTNEDVAKLVGEQMLDNALVAAGLLEDGREMLPRLNSILAALVKPPSSSA